MPLIRGHHSFDDHFTQIPNAWLRDERLSFKARGLLSSILSHSPEWSLTIEWLASHNPEGKEAIRSAVAELELHGYLRREQHNSNGRFGEVTWTTQEPLAENPLAENQPLKKNIEKNTSFKNKERELFDEFWKEYPKKVDKGQAFRQFKRALGRASFEDILAGAIRYASDPNLPEPRFIKYPATWLNADAWENGPLPERKGAKSADENEKRLAEWLKQVEESGQ
jgi:hypothetical protein